MLCCAYELLYWGNGQLQPVIIGHNKRDETFMAINTQKDNECSVIFSPCSKWQCMSDLQVFCSQKFASTATLGTLQGDSALERSGIGTQTSLIRGGKPWTWCFIWIPFFLSDFLGDALLALWRVERCHIHDIITLALKCSFSIQQEFGVRDTEVGLELRVKIGTVSLFRACFLWKVQGKMWSVCYFHHVLEQMEIQRWQVPR